MSEKNILLNSYKLNKLITLKNRIVMAPMTRAKASDKLEPTEEMAQYYARRADAGLIITEGTVIEADASGYKNVPGIFTASHVENWKKVTENVHGKNGVIFLQIWHVGRVSHPTFLQGQLPISPSETVMTGKIPRSHLTYGKSRAATLTEINAIIKNYANASKKAIEAGFDGIEIHGANGYLIDQFLHYSTNKRDDNYGSSPENMARFALEVVKACGEEIGYERVGLRLSPGAYLNEIVGTQADAAVFKYLLEQLNQYPIAYIHTGNFNDSQKFPELNHETMSQFMRKNYLGTLIACGNYSFEMASQGITNHDFDLIAMGRPFIANPDLIQRLHNKTELNSYDVNMLNTLY